MPVGDTELAARRTTRDSRGWYPEKIRERMVSTALKAYALLVTRADKGAVRDLSLL